MDMTNVTGKRNFYPNGENSRKALSYRGYVGSIYKVWIKSLVLNILTLFIYRPWAKTRMRRYLWSNITINGHALIYKGTGKELFKGFIKVALFYFVMSLVIVAISWGVLSIFDLDAIGMKQGITRQDVLQALQECGYKDTSSISEKQYKSCLVMLGLGNPLVVSLVNLFSSMITFFVILYIMFYAQYSALRYRLSRTTWCGIRGALKGKPRKYAFMSIRRLIMNIITLGIAIPKSDLIKQGAITNYMFLGNKKASFNEEKGALGRVNIKTLLLAIPTLGLSRLWYLAALRNQKLANISFGNVHLKGTFTGGKYLRLFLGNLLILIITIGFGMPFIISRMLKFNIKNIQILGDINELSVTQAGNNGDAGNMGEGFEDSLDMDAGLDVDFGLI